MREYCIYIDRTDANSYTTRTSPPGAVGAVGHPFGSEQVGRSQRASRVALSIRSADARPVRGLLSLLLPGCLHPPKPVSGHSGGSLFRVEIGPAHPQIFVSRVVQPVLMTFPQSKRYTMGGHAPLICLWTSMELYIYIYIEATNANSYTICCSERKCAYGAIISG